MKLNEFKQLDERWGWNTDGVNKMGNAQLTSLKNKIVGNADAALDPKELRAKQIFIDDFINKASADLETAIKTGILKPAQATPQTQQPTQGQTQQTQQPASQAQAGQATQAGQPQQPSQPVAPGQQSPEQIRKAKQAAAGQAAQAQMTPKPGQPIQQTTKAGQTQPGQPAVWKNNRAPAGTPASTSPQAAAKTAATPTAPNQTQTSPAQPTKMTPQQTAALKGRLKAGAGATSGQSGFKNYVGGSGERMTGVDKSGAPIFKKIQRESQYSKLNAIFESILSEQEAGDISSFVLNAFKKFAHGPGLSDPELMKQAQQLANEVEATYSKDKGMAALRKLGDLGYKVATAQGQEEPAGQTQSGGTAQPTPGGTAQPGGATAKQVYQQISKLLDPLDPASQQKVVTGLEKYVQMN